MKCASQLATLLASALCCYALAGDSVAFKLPSDAEPRSISIPDNGLLTTSTLITKCYMYVDDNYENALVPEMDHQVSQSPDHCTVAWKPNKCSLQGDCPDQNEYSYALWNACGVRTPSISMRRDGEGNCNVECSDWNQQTAMAHNCVWQETNGTWQIWGASDEANTWCPGCRV